eukprot:2503952-Pleurochrysis_carterae.AAC.2
MIDVEHGWPSSPRLRGGSVVKFGRRLSNLPLQEKSPAQKSTSAQAFFEPTFQASSHSLRTQPQALFARSKLVFYVTPIPNKLARLAAPRDGASRRLTRARSTRVGASQTG